MRFPIAVLLLLCLLASCSVERRHYLPGFYVDKKKRAEYSAPSSSSAQRSISPEKKSAPAFPPGEKSLVNDPQAEQLSEDSFDAFAVSPYSQAADTPEVKRDKPEKKIREKGAWKKNDPEQNKKELRLLLKLLLLSGVLLGGFVFLWINSDFSSNGLIFFPLLLAGVFFVIVLIAFTCWGILRLVQRLARKKG